MIARTVRSIARVLVGWGAAVVFVRLAEPDVDTSGICLAGAAAGLMAGVELARRGFAVDHMTLAATLATAGALLALSTRVYVSRAGRDGV